MGKPIDNISMLIGYSTLIMEVTEAKCKRHGKDYEAIGEYMWLLLQDGLLSKEAAKQEFEEALTW